MMQKTKLTSFMLLTVVLTACTPSAQQHSVAKLTDTGSPALHAIDNNDLRQLMQRMNAMMYERNLTDHEMDVQRREVSSRIITAAIGVDSALDGMVATLPKLNLDQGERKTFNALATNLRSEARKLKAQAEANQVEETSATLERMAATCTTCHELFRDTTKGVQK